MKDRELIKEAMAFAVKDITGETLRDATLESMVDDFEGVDMESFEYKGRVYESDLYCFDVTKHQKDDGTDYPDVYITFTDKRENPYKKEYWENPLWMIGVLNDNEESLKDLDVCKQGIKETKHVFQDLVNIGWLK